MPHVALRCQLPARVATFSSFSCRFIVDHGLCTGNKSSSHSTGPCSRLLYLLPGEPTCAESQAQLRTEAGEVRTHQPRPPSSHPHPVSKPDHVKKLLPGDPQHFYSQLR